MDAPEATGDIVADGHTVPSDLHVAYDYCQRVARERARNFYYAFRTLPRERRRAIYAAYAFCRLCDDIADGDLPLAEKHDQFLRLRQQLASSRDGQPAGPVLTALQDATRAFKIPGEYFEEIIEGVEMDLAPRRFQTFEELEGYCYKVASVVGLVCVEVFGYREPAARGHAVDLGLAMQLTNILRDLKEDADRGRVYIPLDDIQRFGYSEAELIRGEVNAAFLDLMRFQAQRARRYFDSGRRLLPLVPSRSRACPAVLLETYSTLLDRIERSNFDVFDRRISLGAPRKLWIMAKLWASTLLPNLVSAQR